MKMILIEDCCEILDSKRIPITAKNRIPGPYPYYGANGIQDYVDNYIFDDELVLLAEDGGNFGSTEKPIAYRVSGKCWVNNHAHVLKPRKGIDVDYLCYSLMFYDTNGLVNGATRQKLTQSTLKKMSIPKRTVKQQLQIVQELNTIKKLITARKQELQKLDDLIKARFVEMFGDPAGKMNNYPKKRFDELCENLDSKRKPITASVRESGNYPYYGASGIVDYVADYIFDEDILLVSEDGANLLMRSTPIAFSVSGKVWVNNHAHVVRFKNIYMQKYIEVYFSMIDISDQITGSAQPKLNQAKLNALEFALPEDALLLEYYDFVTQIDKSKATVQKALDETQLLFDSLMQLYFG